MKSLHVPFGFYPDAVGGTEVYVAGLAAALTKQNHPAVIAAPAPSAAHYVHDGLPVYRFAVSDAVTNLLELHDEGDPAAAEAFANILDAEKPDVVHLHAFTRACSVRLVRATRARGIPVVFTYHTPTVSCARGTMMLWGNTPCDGELQVARCTACTLNSHGVPRGAARLLALIPPTSVAAHTSVPGRIGTAFRFSSLISSQHSAIRELFHQVDRIVAFREWVRALLTANGVPAAKIVSSRHALCHAPVQVQHRVQTGRPARTAFLGRIEPTKGLDVLIRAMRLIPNERLTLDVFGVVQGDSGRQELARLQRLAAEDARIALRAPLSPDDVVATLAEYDALLVPSQWMETGPLVVLEAAAAHTPVVGSALGGIAELVADGRSGLLVQDYRSPQAWALSLTRLAREPELIATLSAGIQAPPTMERVATEMIDVYRDLTTSQPRGVPMVSSVA